jgi:hypothetical protein
VRILIGIITILAGLPALGGIYLLYKWSNPPTGVLIVIVNAVLFRGFCGTIGGGLLLLRRKWGYYLTALSWLYMITVSFMTVIKLYRSDMIFDAGLISQNLSTVGEPLAWSAAKIILGIPIIYYVAGILFKRRLADGNTGQYR